MVRLWSPRHCISFAFFSYMLMMTVLLIHLHVEESPDVILKRNQKTPIQNVFHMGLMAHDRNVNTSSINSDADVQSQLRIASQLTLSPIETPKVLTKKPLAPKFGKAPDSFRQLDYDVFVYSAFLDSRLLPSKIRLLTLASLTSATAYLYCHYETTGRNVTFQTERYELCENHNRQFGGYFYSCQVPDFVSANSIQSVRVSWKKWGKQVSLPVHAIKQTPEKLVYLDSYPDDAIQNRVEHYRHLLKRTESKSNQVTKHQQVPNNLHFAICVPPLFGTVSSHRLVEFIELSLILGADHIVFYNYSISPSISKVLAYYESKDVVSLLPWRLPDAVSTVDIWYYGQLLANNDCLYRSMSVFDLVAFNDIDEFIVPHNGLSNWPEVFPKLLGNHISGFSLTSAFFDPGFSDMTTTDLITTTLSTRTRKFSKVRSKVLVCPWRVFEVGIHHISKQNQERWVPMAISNDTAFLHHYRRCLSTYDMQCNRVVKDGTVTKQYGKQLMKNYLEALEELGLTEDVLPFEFGTRIVGRDGE